MPIVIPVFPSTSLSEYVPNLTQSRLVATPPGWEARGKNKEVRLFQEGAQTIVGFNFKVRYATIRRNIRSHRLVITEYSDSGNGNFGGLPLPLSARLVCLPRIPVNLPFLTLALCIRSNEMKASLTMDMEEVVEAEDEKLGQRRIKFRLVDSAMFSDFSGKDKFFML